MVFSNVRQSLNEYRAPVQTVGSLDCIGMTAVANDLQVELVKGLNVIRSKRNRNKDEVLLALLDIVLNGI